jgi:hypothetical protein
MKLHSMLAFSSATKTPPKCTSFYLGKHVMKWRREIRHSWFIVVDIRDDYLSLVNRHGWRWFHVVKSPHGWCFLCNRSNATIVVLYAIDYYGRSKLANLCANFCHSAGKNRACYFNNLHDMHYGVSWSQPETRRMVTSQETRQLDTHQPFFPLVYKTFIKLLLRERTR